MWHEVVQRTLPFPVHPSDSIDHAFTEECIIEMRNVANTSLATFHILLGGITYCRLPRTVSATDWLDHWLGIAGGAGHATSRSNFSQA